MAILKRKMVLDHLARYSITIRPVLVEHLFGGSDSSCHNTINGLLGERLIKSVPGALPSHSYYRLTPRGAVEAGLSKNAGAKVHDRLREHLGVLWFSFMNRERRTLLTRAEMQKVLPSAGERLRSPHCFRLARNPVPETPKAPHYRWSCIYRLRIAGPRSNDARLLRSVEDYKNAAAENLELKKLLRDQQYGFAILADKNRIKKLKVDAKRRNLGRVIIDGKTFTLRLLFEPIPDVSTLKRDLDGRQKK